MEEESTITGGRDNRRYIKILTSKAEHARQRTAEMTLVLDDFPELRKVLLRYMKEGRHQRRTSEQHVESLKLQYQRITDTFAGLYQ